jgi:hypothetical protein
MAEATKPCGDSLVETSACARLDVCAKAWSCNLGSEPDGDIGKALRNAALLSLPLYAFGLLLVAVALKGCP